MMIITTANFQQSVGWCRGGGAILDIFHKLLQNKNYFILCCKAEKIDQKKVFSFDEKYFDVKYSVLL